MDWKNFKDTILNREDFSRNKGGIKLHNYYNNEMARLKKNRTSTYSAATSNQICPSGRKI
ncbi:4171_t:CDS:2 [Entrophospora sp. SA101]|nr:4171_t:CDS:2 [Entrophospora sp. SA101]